MVQAVVSAPTASVNPRSTLRMMVSSPAGSIESLGNGGNPHATQPRGPRSLTVWEFGCAPPRRPKIPAGRTYRRR
jgi:hypothetical protein